MKVASSTLRSSGIIGLSIVSVLNLFAHFYLEQPAAVLFCESWWSSWLPAYIVWVVLLVVSFGIRNKSRCVQT